MTDANARVYVELVRYARVDSSGMEEIVKRVESLDRRHAERIERGLNINLNHDEYFTRIVEG